MGEDLSERIGSLVLLSNVAAKKVSGVEWDEDAV